MTDLLLTQDVFLLAHDDETGKNEASLALAGALSGALLLDLAAAGQIEVTDKKVHAVSDAPVPADELLARAAAAVRAETKERDAGRWLAMLPKKLKPLDRAVGSSLVTRGVVSEQRAKTLGIFDTTRWPERDPEPERRLRAELRTALVEGAEPSVRVLLLSGLLHQYGLVDKVVAKDERRAARKRAGVLAKQAETSDRISAAVGQSVRAAQAAMMAAIIASTAASTAASVNSN